MTKIITVGVPYALFGQEELKLIKKVLIERIESNWTYEAYHGKLVRVAMRLPAEVVDRIRTEAAGNYVNNLEYTAGILALKGV